MRLKWLVITAVFLAVCSPIAAQEVHVDRNVMAFASFDAYDRYASNEYDRTILQHHAWNNDSLTTRAERGAGGGDDVYPEFLNMVLNEDNIVRISSFLVKVDLDNGFALAIDANAPNAYWSLQNNDHAAPGMLYFDGESDDALEVMEGVERGWLTVEAQAPRVMDLEKGRPGGKRSGASRIATNRGCSGASREKCEGNVAWDHDYNPGTSCIYWVYRSDYKVVYQKAIVYFSLQSKQKSKQGCSYANWDGAPSYEAQLQLEGAVRYRKRCGAEVVKNEVLRDVGREQNWRPYEGSRSLSHYEMTVTFGAAHPGETIAKTGTCAIVSGYPTVPAGHPGMTWTALENQSGVVHVGGDHATDPYRGDTAASTSLPVLCLRVDFSGVPPGVSPDFYNGWARGQVALTPAVAGTTLTSRAAADSLCSSHFGPDWRMAEFHDGRFGPNLESSGGWSFRAYGNIPLGTRFWTAIDDQPANPWN